MEKVENQASARVLAEVREAIRKYGMINKGDHVVTGLSGGPDSLCLFFALYKLREELGITLSAVHVNHKFRPVAAEEDQEYVESFCRSLGIDCKVFTFDCNALAEELGLTSEEAGRKVRYEAFDEAAALEEKRLRVRLSESAGERVKIAVAQNANDQAETLLFRLLRGTGTDGLAGTAPVRKSEKGYCIIRPLLKIQRSDIEEFCRENRLEPRIDHTNFQSVYTRNKIRLELIPYISSNFNENITEALNRLAGIAGEDKEYLWKQAEEAFFKAVTDGGYNRGKTVSLDLEALREMDAAIRHRVILKGFSEIGLTQDIGAVHIEGADKIIAPGSKGKTAEFPKGYKLVRRYDNVIFMSPSAEEETGREGKLPKLTERTVFQEEWEKFRIARDGSRDYIAIDKEEYIRSKGGAYLPPILRFRKAGDFMALSGGTKKLQDFLVDSKIPADERDRVLLLASGSEILWIPGKDSGILGPSPLRGRYTSNYRAGPFSKEVLILEIEL